MTGDLELQSACRSASDGVASTVPRRRTDVRRDRLSALATLAADRRRPRPVDALSACLASTAKPSRVRRSAIAPCRRKRS